MYFDTSRFETITTQKQLARWVREIETSKSFCIDTETTGLDVFEDELVGIALSTKRGKEQITGAYIPLAHHGAKQLPVPLVLDALRPALLHRSIGKVFHNALYDLLILSQPRYAVEINNVHDTMWMAYLMTANTEPLDMDFLAAKYLGWKTIKFSDVVTNRPGRTDFRDVPVNEATDYAAEDTAVTFAIAHGFQDYLRGTGKLWDVYTRDRQLIPVLRDMKLKGVKIDTAHLACLQGPWEVETEKKIEGIKRIAGCDLNPASSQQVIEVLTKRGLKLPVDKNGKQSAKKEVLESLEGDELVDAILDYKAKAKLLSTYIRTLPKKVKSHSGRIHGSFNFTGPITGRASSSDPNLQNIPTRTKEGSELRKAFIADKGKLLLSADYSQIEYRVLAHITQSPYLLHCFRNGIDLHAKMAADVLGGEWQEYNDKKNKDKAKARSAFKNVNFAVIYGAGPAKVARMSGIEVGEAYEILDAHREMAPEVYTWKEEVLEFARTHEYVETLFGRRIPLKYINSRNGELRGGSERLAINGIIQGTATGDLMRLALVKVAENLHASADILLTVHDELVVEVDEKYVKPVSDYVKSSMETAADHLVTWTIPIVAEVGEGKTWLDAK